MFADFINIELKRKVLAEVHTLSLKFWSSNLELVKSWNLLGSSKLLEVTTRGNLGFKVWKFKFKTSSSVKFPAIIEDTWSYTLRIFSSDGVK